MSESPILILYALAEPIETPIDSADLSGIADINVEAGGTLTLVNQHGDDFRVALPSIVDFKIKRKIGGEVDEVKSAISQLDGKFADIEKDIGDLKDEMSALQDALIGVDAAITRLEATV